MIAHQKSRAMIDISFETMRHAILSGFDLGGNWQVCRKNGVVYWKHRYLHGDHDAHGDVFVPALYAEGVASQRRLFLSWLRALPDRARVAEVEALIRPNGLGIAYAMPCIIDQMLSDEERASWDGLRNARIMMIAEGTLQVLNAPHGRPRYRYTGLAHTS